jgi:hypothetical protein
LNALGIEFAINSLLKENIILLLQSHKIQHTYTTCM